MNQNEHAALFAAPRARHELTLRRGDRITRLTFPSWIVGAAATALGALVLLSAGSTALLLSNEEIAMALRSREAETVTAYERRIADLRREVDRVTSRELSERRAVTERVGRMLARQQQIDERFSRMEPLLGRARSSGLVEPDVPLPTERPDDSASLAPALNAFAPADDVADVFAGFDLRRAAASGPGGPQTAPRTEAQTELPGTQTGIRNVEERIAAIEDAQIEQLSRAAEAAETRAADVARILTEAGLVPDASELGMGGPFVPVPILDPFANEAERLAGALEDLRLVEAEAAGLPVGAPLEDVTASSNFGVRLDPFLRRPALHAGVDYPAPTGTTVRASGAGRVVEASRSRGGYGLMVEVDHGGGYLTRYAHLSAIDVAVGDTVEAGERLGRVGSTGRSTGPHLHYEVHRGGTARDPSRYLAVGEKLDRLL